MSLYKGLNMLFTAIFIVCFLIGMFMSNFFVVLIGAIILSIASILNYRFNYRKKNEHV